MPEPHRSHDWALVPAKPGLQGWILINECNTYWFSPATMVARTCLNVTSNLHCPSCLRFKFSRQFNYRLFWVVSTCVYGNVSSRFGSTYCSVETTIRSFFSLHHISQNVRLQCRSHKQKIFHWNVGCYLQHWTALRLTGVYCVSRFCRKCLASEAEQRTLRLHFALVSSGGLVGKQQKALCVQILILSYLPYLELCDRVRVDKPKA